MSATRTEARLRRIANSYGLALCKSRERDPRSLTYGGFMIVDRWTNGVVAGADPRPYFLDLDDVSAFLESLD